MGRRMRPEVRAHGGPFLRVKRADLAPPASTHGCARRGVRDGRPVLEDERVLDVADVVWCTGFRKDIGWIDLPIPGEDGWPIDVAARSSRRRVCTSSDCPSSRIRSMLVGGVGPDAEHVAKHIVEHAEPAVLPARAMSPG